MMLGEEMVEIKHAVSLINSIIRRGSLVRIVDKNNTNVSIKLDKEIDIIIADFINKEGIKK